MDRPEKGEEMSEERIKMDRNEEYPNDKETQEWMNGSMGTPMKRESKQHRMEACPECDAEHQETVKFWMDKWEKRSDEFYALESENKDLNQKLSELQVANGLLFSKLGTAQFERDSVKAELKEARDLIANNQGNLELERKGWTKTVLERERQIEVLRCALTKISKIDPEYWARHDDRNLLKCAVNAKKIATEALLSPAPSEKYCNCQDQTSGQDCSRKLTGGSNGN